MTREPKDASHLAARMARAYRGPVLLVQFPGEREAQSA